jgi:hypothetical protein
LQDDIPNQRLRAGWCIGISDKKEAKNRELIGTCEQNKGAEAP